MAVFIGDVKIPQGPRNPDSPAPKGPVFYLFARLWIISRNTLILVLGLAMLTREANSASPAGLSQAFGG
jgi:hypothetical protein